MEIGAAWFKRSKEDRNYLGLKLDDPSSTAPIFANLFADEQGEGFSLIWSRPSRRNGDCPDPQCLARLVRAGHYLAQEPAAILR
ncbi:Protein of unknown function [Bradyrhizobium shewense]|uniref:DUF736 domain-containing protein n=1 Tax=Bradyrhizobium shewense TaxID=1761772 RepID=A0A1C3XI23_9BRAD|nr:Protein of unknown function [Bradyrhizobium shewense]